MEKKKKFRLTKRKALELCRDLWNWLAEDISRHKFDWPGWKLLPRFDAWCPCCEYVQRRFYHNDSCIKKKQCPLFELWPDGCVSNMNSPYRAWRDTSTNDPLTRSQAAKSIADFCQAKLEGEGK